VTGWSVMLRGIRYRSGRSLVVLFLAAFATLAAVLAPAYGRAAAQSVLTDAVRSAPPSATSLTISAESSAAGAGSGSYDPAQHPVAEAKSLVDNAFRQAPNLTKVVDRPIPAVETEAQAALANGERHIALLAWRLGACGQVKMVAGACVVDSEQAMVSERSAAETKLKVGDYITARPSKGEGSGRRLQIVGVYAPKDPAAVYWGNSTYFSHATGARLDTIFTGTEDDVRLPSATGITAKLTYPVKPDEMRLDAMPALRSELGALGLALNSAELRLDTALASIVDGVAIDQDALASAVPLIAVPLLLIAWIVLFILVAAVTEERGPELALARLRGFPQARAARFGFGETLFLIVVGAPLGLAAGLGLVEAAARVVLAGGTHVEPRWPVFAAAFAGLLVATGAAWLATRRTFGSGVLALLRHVPQRAGRRAGVIEAVVVTLAVAGGVVALRDRQSPLALLAPAAIAVVAGIVAGRVLVIWSRMRLAIARRSGSIPGILAAAQLARRPGAARLVVVLTAAVALVSFAAASWDVASKARDRHAEQTLGAATVYRVTAPHPQALIAAVASADPTGRAMAVVRTDEQYGQGRVELIGVQSELLSRVALWRGNDMAALERVGRQLREGAGRPAAVDRDILLRVNTGGLGEIPLRLGAMISAVGQPPTVVWLGDLKAGQKDYSAALPACTVAGACRFAGLALGRVATLTGPIRATLSVQEVRSAGAPALVRLSEAQVWHTDTERNPAAKVAVQPGAALGLTIESGGPGDVVVSYLDTPAKLPVYLSGAVPGDGDDFTFPAFADTQQAFTVVGRADTLPRAGTHALMFDLNLGVRAASATAGLADATDLRYEVWAARDATPALATKLADNGVRVVGTQTINSELEQLSRRAPALSFRLYLLAGIAAAGLALGVLALSRRLGAADRRAELASLRATGVRSRTLRRALRRERMVSIVLPLLIGLVAGVGAAYLMLPGVALVTVGQTAPLESLWPNGFELAALPGVVTAAILVVFAGLFSSGGLLRGGAR